MEPYLLAGLYGLSLMMLQFWHLFSLLHILVGLVSKYLVI